KAQLSFENTGIPDLDKVGINVGVEANAEAAVTFGLDGLPPFAGVRTSGEIATSLEYRAAFDGKGAIDRVFVDLQVPAGTPRHDDLQKLLNVFNNPLKASANF